MLGYFDRSWASAGAPNAARQTAIASELGVLAVYLQRRMRSNVHERALEAVVCRQCLRGLRVGCNARVGPLIFRGDTLREIARQTSEA